VNTKIMTSAASRWANPLCIAPKASLQGTGMPTARPFGYLTSEAFKGLAAPAAKHAATTHLAVRQGADVQVPPRGRPV
jgi:hypothetical protein